MRTATADAHALPERGYQDSISPGVETDEYDGRLCSQDRLMDTEDVESRFFIFLPRGGKSRELFVFLFSCFFFFFSFPSFFWEGFSLFWIGGVWGGLMFDLGQKEQLVHGC